MQRKPQPIDTKDVGKFCSDPERSWTLPGRYYYDPEVYAHELDSIFYRSWQYVCHQSRLQRPGAYCTREIGDESVFVVKDEQNALRGYYNVCQHRAHRLLENEGLVGTGITCPYHAWRYGLGGELQFARGSDNATDFPLQEIHLQTVQVDTLLGFVFVNLDLDAPPMTEVYPGLEEEIRALAPEAENLVRAYSRRFELAANWKNSLENYAECYHCPNRHPSLVNGALDITKYRIEVNEGYHRHITTDVGAEQGYTVDDEVANCHEFGSWLVWPNMVFEVYPGGNLTVFHHVPDGAEHTVQETEWYFPDYELSAAQQDVIDFVNVVREEDIPICESVQRGLHSRGYTQGRFIVDKSRTYVSEHAVHDFQLRVLNALNQIR